MKNIGFFFGAGAEKEGFGMPSGGEYTLQTMLRKRTKLYDALGSFYERRLVIDYVDSYQSRFMFQKNSPTFLEIVRRSVKKCKGLNYDGIEEETKDLIKILEQEELFKTKVQQAYEEIIADWDDTKSVGKYKTLIENFSYYGSIEKDFSAIIDPSEAEYYKFWRLVNYFWSAYFSIIIPILDNSSEYSVNNDYTSNKYAFVLKHLQEITDYIYSYEHFIGSYKASTENTENKIDYYTALRVIGINIKSAITTNYTPFIQSLGLDKNETVFLAGELCLFELPHQLYVKDIRVERLSCTDFIFPYLCTQAPVKPIIETKQIRAYYRALECLDNLDILIVLGYSLNNSDNHINAILREFVLNKAKRFIYCKYIEDADSDANSIPIWKKLRLENKTENVEILLNNGNPVELAKKISNIL